MAVAFNSATSTNGNASSFTFSHTPAGADRILLVYIAYKDSSDVESTVVFNTTESLTRLSQGSYGATQFGSLWYLLNPTATTANVVVTLTTAERAAIGAVSYTGVEAIETGNFSTTSGQDTNPLNSITTVNADSLAVHALSVRDRSTGFTDDVNWTLRYTDNSTGNPANRTAFSRGYDRSTPTTGLYTSSTTISATEAWVSILAELRAATAAGRSYGFIL